MRDPRPSRFSSPQNMSDLLGPLDVLRTQRGTLHQKSCRTHQAERQYLRFWGCRGEVSAADWGAQELELPAELPAPASVPRPWRRPEPVGAQSCNEASNSSARVSCLLRSRVWGLELVVVTGPAVWHRTPAAPALGRGKLPFFRRCSGARS